MKKYKIKAIMVFLSTIGVCPQIFAHQWAEKNCSDANGIICWQCGTTCTATLYDGGELVISGTGAISPGNTGSERGNETLRQAYNQRLPQAVTSVKINEGITSIGDNSFWYVSTIKKVELPDSVTSAVGDALATGGSFQLIISENSSVSTFSDRGVGSVFCRGEISNCRQKLESVSNTFKNKVITNELHDSEGNLLEKCDSSGCITFDSDENKTAKYTLNGKLLEEYNKQGNVIAQYDSEGNLLKSYTYGSNGTYAVYDSNHKLIGLKKDGAFTPAEAAALIKKGNDNKVTLTFK